MRYTYIAKIEVEALADPGESEETIRHNARALITAAPNLLEACKRLDAYWTDSYFRGPDDPRAISSLAPDTLATWRAIRAAIARAEDRQ
jgi:hypothetical protein